MSELKITVNGLGKLSQRLNEMRQRIANNETLGGISQQAEVAGIVAVAELLKRGVIVSPISFDTEMGNLFSLDQPMPDRFVICDFLPNPELQDFWNKKPLPKLSHHIKTSGLWLPVDRSGPFELSPFDVQIEIVRQEPNKYDIEL